MCAPMKRLAAALVALTSLVALPASAQDFAGPGLTDLVHARNVGMGGAYRSLGYGGEVVTGNPAAMSLYKRYQVEASASWDIPNGFGLATVALADSTTAVAAGVAYQFVTYGGQERRSAHLSTLALATGLGEVLHVGISARHQVIVGATNANSIAVAAGLALRPVEWLTLGVSGHNLNATYNRDVTRFFVGSVSGLFLNQLSPAVDVRADFNLPTPRFALHAGLEWLVDKTWPLRIGYERDGIRGREFLSGGVGYFDAGSGVDLGYRHELGGDGGRMIALTAKLQI
jgi:hypothetical protein